MRKIVCMLSLVLLALTASAQSNTADSSLTTSRTDLANASSESLLKMAADLYAKGQYAESAYVYEDILKNHGISDKVYFNLGNAYFKCDKLAPAILNFERALRLNPRDADARFNLEMCNARIVDKIDPIGMFLIARWYHSLGNLYSSNGWAYVSISFFLMFIGCLFAYFFARRRWLKKSGFFFGILFLVISTLSLVYSAQSSRRITHPNEAILYSLSVTVKSSPDKSGTDLFVLHEGTKMTVRSILGDWSEIELEDGNVGWLLSKDIQIIES